MVAQRRAVGGGDGGSGGVVVVNLIEEVGAENHAD